MSLSQFRGRLLEHDFAMVLLQQTLQSAKDAGLFGEENLHAIDSFMVHGAAAKQDTFTLIRSAVSSLLRLARMHSLEQPFREVLVRDDYELRGKVKIDWNDPQERQRLLQSLVEDGRRLLAVALELAPLPGDLQRAVDLLQRVIEQDIETRDDGTIHIRRGTAKDRIISTVDPDMRHGRKTTSAKTDGYKTHLLTTGKDGDLIAGVEVTGANIPDGDVTQTLLDDADERGHRPKQLLGDTAYFDPEVVEAEAAKGTVIIAKAPPVPKRGDMFTKDGFSIDTTKGEITCPAGHAASFDTARIEERQGATVHFPSSVCQACPLRAQCTTNDKGRTIRIHPYEPELPEARQVQQTEEFQKAYAKRSVIERVNSHVTRSGGRRARYIGLVKVKMQQILVAVNHNIKVITRPRGPNKGHVCPA